MASNRNNQLIVSLPSKVTVSMIRFLARQLELATHKTVCLPMKEQIIILILVRNTPRSSPGVFVSVRFILRYSPTTRLLPRLRNAAQWHHPLWWAV